ncbi:TPA: hypothetical protein J1015_004713, partial [Escherichia coli]|nr:hypothetical protein [Escherichia coli]HAZ3670898.1 hypothetical protein [Escherichia coli]HBA8215871.1 hypothetical protein [Escherichia coli]
HKMVKLKPFMDYIDMRLVELDGMTDLHCLNVIPWWQLVNLPAAPVERNH